MALRRSRGDHHAEPGPAAHHRLTTTVCVRLCASMPRVTMVQSPFTTTSGRDGTGRQAHHSGGDATLLSSHAGRFRASGRRQKA